MNLIVSCISKIINKVVKCFHIACDIIDELITFFNTPLSFRLLCFLIQLQSEISLNFCQDFRTQLLLSNSERIFKFFFLCFKLSIQVSVQLFQFC